MSTTFQVKTLCLFHEIKQTWIDIILCNNVIINICLVVGETPFNCQDCGARFWKQENLDVHQRKQCISRSDGMPLTAADGATTPGDITDVEVEGVQEEQDVPYVCTITEVSSTYLGYWRE